MKSQQNATSQPVVGSFKHPIRTFFAGIFGAIAVLLILLSILTVWLNRTLTDTDNYVKTVAPLSADPEVQEYIAGMITAGILESGEHGDKIAAIVPATEAAGKTPEQLQETGKRKIKESILKVIQSDKFQDQWVETNKKAHTALVGQMKSKDAQLVLDLEPALLFVFEQLKTTELAPIATNITLPPGVGKVSLQNSPIDSVRTSYDKLQNAPMYIVIAAVVSIGLCVLLSVQHIKTIRRILVMTGISTLFFAAGLEALVLLDFSSGGVLADTGKVAVAVINVLFHDLKIIMFYVGAGCITLALISKLISVLMAKKGAPAAAK
jgi:hypothetical protein